MTYPLQSPGTDISVTDDSAYASAGQGTVPLIIIGTHAYKTQPGGSGVATGTLPENANRLFPITSQRELLQTFGNPVFYTKSGSSVHGYELNEYGLHAAYQYLGIANKAFVVRGDIDFSQLVPRTTAPTGEPANATEWIDGKTNTWNIFQYETGTWKSKSITLVDQMASTEIDDRVAGQRRPTPTQGGSSIGDLAMVAVNPGQLALYQRLLPTNNNASPWYLVGSADWIAQKIVTYTTSTTTPAASSYLMAVGRPAVGVEGDILLLTSPNNTTAASSAANWQLKTFSSATGSWIVYTLPVRALPIATAQIGYVYAQADTAHATFALKMYDSDDTTLFPTQPVYVDYLTVAVSNIQPTTPPDEGTLWYNPTIKVEVKVGDGQAWQDYVVRYPQTNPTGVILSGSAPVKQDDGTPLVEFDLWLDTSDLENFPKMYRYTAQSQWVLIDAANDYDPVNGIAFGEEAETSALGYDDGMRLFNLTNSTYTVKQYTGGAWKVASGKQTNGVPFFGRKAQRAMVVTALASTISTNQNIRSEGLSFSLIAAPGYIELIDEMVTLNTDQKNTAFIIGDTPARLEPTGVSIQTFASAALSGVASNSESGVTTFDPYVGMYYPWGMSTNVDGTDIMVPPSTLALRTMAYNDSVGYPWLAPAGTTRGLVTNASSVGYLGADGEYKVVLLTQGQRDILYQNKINPIAYLPNKGLVVFGQKTRSSDSTAMDRINVARLMNYLRVTLNDASTPFYFQPNDTQTRDGIRVVFERLLGDLVGLRGLYDFIVVCDESNNTPERIDRNELWVDIAIQPVKAVEFIYIPIRIVNTGTDLASLF